MTQNPPALEVLPRDLSAYRQGNIGIDYVHRFESGQPYRLRQYFQRVDRRSASVLEQAQPDPLCIDLLQGEQQARRFCRPHDARSGLGEFVEKKP